MLPNDAVSAGPDIAFLIHRMRQIGKRTAEMHIAFASAPDDPVFAPEPIVAEDVARWTDSMANRAQVAFALLDRARGLSEHAGELTLRLLAGRSAILTHIEQYRARPLNGVKIRHHGDFHLGQVLIAKEDAFILDFEGEPRRPLDERRRKAPAARDVAGFVRSIDYAVLAAIEREPNLNAEERASLTQHVRGWGQQLSSAYWESYREIISGAGLWPDEDNQAVQLLDIFVLEKVLYEIEYELANRPDWVHIPLAAALRILEQRGVLT
jgi:maltose alpha-D-glucosyltransferase/alpha-amylase